MARVLLEISGRVQGVGYRWFAVQMATDRGIVGAVRNESDRSVSIDAVAEEEVLQEFIKQLRIGPPSSRVDHIEIRWSDLAHDYRDFRVDR